MSFIRKARLRALIGRLLEQLSGEIRGLKELEYEFNEMKMDRLAELMKMAREEKEKEWEVIEEFYEEVLKLRV